MNPLFDILIGFFFRSNVEHDECIHSSKILIPQHIVLHTSQGIPTPVLDNLTLLKLPLLIHGATY